MSSFSRIFSILGLDSATATVLIGRVWSLASGPIGLIMVVRFLTPVEQGYIGIFDSLLALRIFLELGLEAVIMQFVSHERKDLELTKDFQLSGGYDPRMRIASLFKTSVKWYACLSLIFMLVFPTAGYLFMHRHQDAAEGVNWFGALVGLALVSPISILFQPWYGILEGLGKIGPLSIINLINSIFLVIGFWAALGLNFGLMAVPVSSLCGAVPGIWYIWRWRNLFKHLWDIEVPPGAGISWRDEVLPLQLRTAATNVLVYFIFNLTIPIIFVVLGAVSTGEISQTNRLLSAVMMLANAWIITRNARYGRLIAEKKHGELLPLMRQGLIMSVTAGLLGCLAVLGVVVILQWAHNNSEVTRILTDLGLIKIAELVLAIPSRLTTLTIMIGLCLNTALSVFIYALHAIARAHRREPFLPNAIVAAITVPLIVYLGATYFGLVGVAYGLFLRTLLIELPLTLRQYHKTCDFPVMKILFHRSIGSVR